MALPSDPNKLILTDADITRAGALKAALDSKAAATRFRSGTGSPQGVVTAPPGTEYVDTAGTLGAWKWLKKAGTGTTGWEVTDGDTGWVVISSWDSAGTVTGQPMPANLVPSEGVAGEIKVRRNQNTAFWSILGATWVGLAQIPIPSGFRPEHPTRVTSVFDDNVISVTSVSIGTMYIGRNGSKASAQYGSVLSYPISGHWPTSL